MLQLAIFSIGDVGNLLRALVTFGMIDKARTMQASFDDFLAKLRTSIDEIFIPLQLALNEVDKVMLHDALNKKNIDCTMANVDLLSHYSFHVP